MAEELLAEIRADPNYGEFCKPDFVAAAFASKIVASDRRASTVEYGRVVNPGSGARRSAEATSAAVSSRAETTLEDISAHVTKVETAIRAHVLENESDFFSSVGGVSELAGRCDNLWMGVRDLKRSVAKIKREVMEPYEGVRLRTVQLHNVQAAGRLVKRVLRLLAGLKRLRAQESALGLPSSAPGAALDSGAGGPGAGATRAAELRELAVAGQSLREIEAILADPEMKGVAVAEKERRYVEGLATAVRRAAAEALARGLSGAAPADVASALQVFHNLHCLPERVKGCVGRLVDAADARCTKAFSAAALAQLSGDKQGASGSGAFAGGAGAGATGGGMSSNSTTPVKSGPGTSGGVAGMISPAGGANTASPQPSLSAKEQEAFLARQRRARLREHAEELASALQDTTMQAWSLQRVLTRKRDPSTHELFHDVVCADSGAGMPRGAFRAYWERMCATVGDNLRRALATTAPSGSSTTPEAAAARAVLLQLYPPLRQALLAMVRRLHEAACTLAGESGAAAGPGAAAIGAASAAAGGEDGRHSLLGSGGRGAWLPPAGTLGGPSLLDLALESDSDDEDDAAVAAHANGAGGLVKHHQASSNGLDASSSSRGGGEASRRSSSSAQSAMAGLQVGGDERDALLNALGPLRDSFLAQSLERLTRPVEQMFPRFEGYMAAVPSKHDLSSFVRAARAEMALATAADGGDPTLAPLLMRGVAKAVALLASKAEALVSTDAAAYAFPGVSPALAMGASLPAGFGVAGARGKSRAGGGGGAGGSAAAGGPSSPSGAAAAAAAATSLATASWAPTPEQSHNMQLLELLCRLRESLISLPVAMASQPQQGGLENSNPEFAAGAGVAQAAADDEAARAEERCRAYVREAVATLEDVALSQVLEPYLFCAAAALEGVLSSMHRENFGSGGGGGEGASAFINALHAAVAELAREHLTRVSRLRAPFAEEALRQLASRLLLSYVSHAALVRPLEEAGKLRMTRDMSAVEEIVAIIAPPPALLTAYAELRAFRQLLFTDAGIGGAGSAASGSGGGGGPVTILGNSGHGQRSSSSSVGQQRAFLTEPCLASLRPSTVWHHLFAQAPHELSSPHIAAGKSEQAFVTWLLSGDAAAEWRARSAAAAAANASGTGGTTKAAAAAAAEAAGATSGAAARAAQRSLAADVSYAAEAAAWICVQECLDNYHQRRSATGSARAPLPAVVTLLAEAGPVLLAGYEERRSSAAATAGKAH